MHERSLWVLSVSLDEFCIAFDACIHINFGHFMSGMKVELVTFVAVDLGLVGWISRLIEIRECTRTWNHAT